MPKPLDAPKIDRLIAEVAARHGVLLKRDDAAFALVTLNQLVLEDAIKGLAAEIRAVTADFESAFERVQKRAGAAVARDLSQLIGQIQSEAEASVARLNQTHRVKRPVVRDMLPMMAFVAGLMLGLFLHWVC